MSHSNKFNMKKTYLTLLACCFILTSNAQNPELEWVKQTGEEGYDGGNSITIDVNGNIYITGRFEGTVDFDPGTDVQNLTSSGGYDIFIQKLDANGNLIWVKKIGGGSWDISNAITTDAEGNVYTTGWFGGTVDFDPGVGVYNLSVGFTSSVFIQKLDTDGNFLWANKIQGTYDMTGNAITTDPEGNVYTTGSLQGTADFDPGPGVENLSSTQWWPDIFIQKLDTDGNFLWAQCMASTDWNESKGITTDKNGNIYTTGYFQGTTDFDPGPGVYNLDSKWGSSDIFIQKLDPDGKLIWAKAMGGINWDVGNAITIDKDGNVYTTGSFKFTVDFDPGEGVEEFTTPNTGFMDMFIQKLDADGNFLWAKQMGGIYDEEGLSITTDDEGNVYTTGGFSETVDFDPGTGVQELTSKGSKDIFIQKLDADGNFVWVQQMGGEEYQAGNSIVLDADKNVYTTGSFGGTVDFDPGTDEQNLTSLGSLDVFVQKLRQTTVGVVENSLADNFVLFPNPTNRNFTIEFDEVQENLTIRLLSVSGQILESNDFRNIRFIQQEIHHPAGIYLLEMIDNDGNKATLKLIKSK